MVRLNCFKRNCQKKNKGRFIRPFFYFTLLWQTDLAASDWKINFQIDNFSVSESTSIRSISGKWNDPVGSGDEALTTNRQIFSVHKNSFSLGYIQRYDIYYQYANDTVALLYLTENQLDLPIGKTFPLIVQAKKSSSYGLRLGYSWDFNRQLALSSYVNLLNPQTLLMGSLTGQATTVAAGDYDFSFSSDLIYDDDPLYSRPEQSLNGDGYSVDISLSYNPSERWQVKLDLLDITGQLNISEAPHTIATASSDIKRFDENGYVIYDPAVTGFESNQDATFKFDMQTHVNFIYRWDSENNFSIQHHRLRGFEYQQLEWIKPINDTKFSLILIPRLEALGINIASNSLSIGLLSDDIDYEKMKVLKFNINYIFRF